MNKAILNSDKGSELQIIIWLLEAGWEVFTPVVDKNQTDLVVRRPKSSDFLGIQIKHKQDNSSSDNEGVLKNLWRTGKPPFDFLIFYQPFKLRGIIRHSRWLKDEGI